MIPTNPEHVIAFDCDDTLVMHSTHVPHDLKIADPYNKGHEVSVRIHKKHVKLLKDHFARGYYVMVWSHGGYEWAKAVVVALGLQDYVHHIMAKPSKMVDDLTAAENFPTVIYLGE